MTTYVQNKNYYYNYYWHQHKKHTLRNLSLKKQNIKLTNYQV